MEEFYVECVNDFSEFCSIKLMKRFVIDSESVKKCVMNSFKKSSQDVLDSDNIILENEKAK